MNVLAERVDFVKVRRLSAGYWVFFFFFNAMRPFDVNPLTFDERLIDYFFRKLLFLDTLRMEEGMEVSKIIFCNFSCKFLLNAFKIMLVFSKIVDRGLIDTGRIDTVYSPGMNFNFSLPVRVIKYYS